MKELTQSDSEIVFVPYDEAYEEGFEDMPRRVPDISKVSELVGFRPEMSLDGILESVIDYQSGRRSSDFRELRRIRKNMPFSPRTLLAVAASFG